MVIFHGELLVISPDANDQRQAWQPGLHRRGFVERPTEQGMAVTGREHRCAVGKSWEHRRAKWGNHWKVMGKNGKIWENHGKIMGKSGKSWEHVGNSWDIQEHQTWLAGKTRTK